VAETYRNLSAVGATPLAITNCLNFANPQRPEIMAQIVGCLEGMADACRTLDYPIVSGNVSLYNESKATGGGSAILPTPAIGGVGLLTDYSKSATIAFKAEGESIIVIGSSNGHMGQSLWLSQIHGREDGAPPPVDLAKERLHGEFVRKMIGKGLLTAVHDVSDGGLAVAVAEMALAGGIGCTVNNTYDVVHEWFSECQGRYVVTTREPEKLIKALEKKSIYFGGLGKTGGDAIVFNEYFAGSVAQVSLADLREANDSFFREWMEG
jgi:phosphoribosylformylglycinamidine synthase